MRNIIAQIAKSPQARKRPAAHPILRHPPAIPRRPLSRIKPARGIAEIIIITMPAKIHYGDNIFYLETFIRTIKNGLALEIDQEYFGARLLEDILFLDSSLNKIHASLKANAHLIRKSDYLRALLRAKRNFAGILKTIVTEKPPGAACLQTNFSKLKICEAQHIRDIEELRSAIEIRAKDPAPESDVISGEEFRFLLTPAEAPQSKKNI
jgi:hypothetical protein